MQVFVKTVLLVAVIAKGVQPVIVFNVNRGINGGSMQIVLVMLLISQLFPIYSVIE